MKKRPNIVFLMPDQLRPDFLGCYGADFLRTPAIDALAARGRRWETAISPSPICVPARASMLTGQHAHATGVIDNLSWLRPDRATMGVRTWPEHLADAGYHTIATGKMHFYPWDISEGFQTRITAEDKRHIHVEDDYHDALVAAGYAKQHAREHPSYHEQKGATVNPLPDALHVDRWVATQTADLIRRLDHEQPFALMVGFPGPHCPYDPPAEALAGINPEGLPPALPQTRESAAHREAFLASYKRDWADLDYSDLTPAGSQIIRHHYAALVERLDEDVATIMGALKQAGHLDNTVVIFASDHGDYLGDFGLMGKSYFHEPAVRVPLVIADFRAAAGDTGDVVATPASLIDLFPTFLDLAEVPHEGEIHGQTLLQDGDEARVIVGMTSHGIMARDARFKLVRYRSGVEGLFDLRDDPGEQHNVIADHPEARSKLDSVMTRELLKGLLAGHADKRVPEAQAPAGHGFYRRGWSRPYPALG